MQKTILKQLDKIEVKENISILYAVESEYEGSGLNKYIKCE